MQSGSEIAIIGYACRVPGARNVAEFWKLLKKNCCSVSWITPDRFPTKPYFHPAAGQSGRSYTFAAGVIDDVWGFDATAFGMSPREAEQVDPQHRHLLEVAHDALTHAGVRPSGLSATETGVYIGASSADYVARFFSDPAIADVHMMTGNSVSIMANRISYALNLRGPSLAIDTACSSSLVALHLAAEAIRNGTIDTAIVGGVNLLLSPFSYVGFSQASMLSPTGLCRPFDAAADGYVRSEGVIAVVLRSMAAAHKARNHIHGVIVGSGMNQDGRTTGLSLPSAESQQRLLDKVYEGFAVDPADLLFMEAHGTGTRVGDPIEAYALGHGIGQKRAQPLPIGSVKSNVGHLEPVSGLAGLLKTVQALNHGLVPATLHQKSPSADIPFDELNLKVIARNWRPPQQRGAALAGVNSFGFGGTNAHAIVRSDDSTSRLVYLRNIAPPPPLLLTAHSAEALPALAAAYDRQWPQDPHAAAELISASAHLRDPLSHRVLIRGGTIDEIRHHVRRLSNADSTAAETGHAIGSDLPVAFLFSGNGAQWAGMGREAWHANRHFRAALEEVDSHFAKVQKWSIIDQLFDQNLATTLRLATYAQPMLLALQVATVRALENAGVTPTATLGHSVGEIAAAWAAGALSLEQAIGVVVARSRNQEVARDAGAMAALMLSEREARRFLGTLHASNVEIAAINSWRNVTVSGPAADVETVLAAAAKQRVSARRVDLDYPFHSALIEPVRWPLLRELDGLKPLLPRRQMISSVTGEIAEAGSLGAEYWWRNVREPVRFEAALNRLLQEGVRVFVEIGPKPILSSYVRDTLREAGARGAIIDTLNETAASEATDPIEQAVSKLLLAGGSVDLVRFFGPPPATAVAMPLYPWQHTPFMVRPTPESGTALMEATHPLLGRRLRLDCTEWFSTVDPALFPWLDDHKVGTVSVLPATAYVEVMLGAARERLGDGALELRDLDILRPLVFEPGTSFETLVRLAPETGVVEFMSRPRDGLPDWTLQARAVVGRSPIAAKLVAAPETPPGTVVVAKAKVYEWARSLGFAYGPAFQRTKQVAFPHPKRAIATLDAPAAQTVGPYVIDLTALDSAFHALFASEEAGVADMPMRPMLPIRFGCVRAFVPGGVAMTASARTLRQSDTSLLADVDLYDADGRLVLSAERVRLINAPTEPTADPMLLSYRTATWHLERAGRPVPAGIAVAAVTPAGKQAATSAEGLLLLEAGCLRAAWDALSAAGIWPREASETADASRENGPTPAQYLKSALLWHLELRGLAVDDGARRRLAQSCGLPDVPSIVTSLTTRHAAMVAEAASLARIQEILPRLVAQPDDAGELFASLHWRNLGVASHQTKTLHQTLLLELESTIRQCDPGRLLRLLMIGAEHVSAACDLVELFGNVELTIADTDPDRLEQARLMLGEDFPRIRGLTWAAAQELPAGTFDLGFAIDGLSEVAAVADGLATITRLLRPGAPILAAELAPSLFWDIARGSRPTWWARSANADFPVGPLLTAEEWTDDFRLAGFEDVQASSAHGETRLGVLIRARTAQSQRSEPAAPQAFAVSWEGDQAVLGNLQRCLKEQEISVAAEAGIDLSRRPAAPTDIVWAIDATTPSAETGAGLTDVLASIVERFRQLASAPARLWIVIDFGSRDGEEDPLRSPLWCAITSAMRVAQNEYPGLQVRCLGLAESVQPATIAQAADEILAPDAEREIFLSATRRTVLRVQRGAAEARAQRPSQDQTTSLASRQGAGRAGLVWVDRERREPAAGEVEIEVEATGLNFRDVMWNLRLLPEEALEDGYAGAGLGMECAGRISRVGPAVEAFKPGDRVAAFAPGAFASHVVAPAFAVISLPEDLTAEAASTVPVAFLTAYYSLMHLGRLGPGQIVLVHGGAGAVGLAAIQIARQVGARIIATAGTDEKRAFLRNYGADLVCNSRTLSFADEVMEFTQGKGADVVLNSLAGEAMVRSMDCLRPFGRFIELGKRDFYANTHVGLRPLRRNLSYFGVDVDQLIGEHKELARALFKEVLQLFTQGELVALPHRVFTAAHADDAFRLMQRSGHIGKIVVKPARCPTAGLLGGKFPVDADGVHVVIGGTRGFGLATAEWLASRGATNLVLASRKGQLSEFDSQKVDELRRNGTAVTIECVDVTDGAALAQLLRRTEAQRAIKGIVHAAMVIDDRLMEGMDHPSIGMVLEPKVTGALNLEQAIDGLALDYLLFYSSATTVFGNPGQFNYVAANGFLDGLARRLHARGVPALAIAWGGIENAGYLARNISADANLKKRFSSSLISAQTALDGLDWLYDRDGRQLTACCAIGRIDWAMARRELAATRTPTFDAIAAAANARQSTDATAILEKLRALPPAEVTEALLEIVVEEIARVLRLPPKEIDRHRPLAEIGMDSLMMLELRTTVETALQIELPMMSLSSGITPADVARRVAPLITGEKERLAVPGTIVSLSASHFAEEAEATTVDERQAAISAVLERARELEGPL
jgi:acyl transferase domain-containing protein/NADPH:quinone reductase-like Zn-dependent oxidoreductase/acyl carrier protein/short-subunit dehydrogenase